LDLYRAGHLKLDELVTKTYRVEEHQPGLPGTWPTARIVRGVVVYSDADY